MQTLEINRPVTWRSSGSRQAQLMQILGSQGSTVDGSRYGFVLVAANFPSFDTYQDTTIGETAVGLNNISIIGGSESTTPNVNGTVFSNYTIDGLLFQNPTNTARTNVDGVLQNLQVANFPGNALAANKFAGELRGYFEGIMSSPPARAGTAWT